MNHYREKASILLTKLPWKWNPAITVIPVSKTLGSPAPQTSLIFELPNELILLILSHISPEQQFTGHYARFRVQYDLLVNRRHRQWVEFLRPLSMTCKAMRLRLIPFIWEHLHFFPQRWIWGWQATTRLETLLSTLHADMSLAITVKVVSLNVCFGSGFSLFVECLQSLPNLRTLEIRWSDHDEFFEEPLWNALKRVNLPQIKTLTIPPTAHPLLRHCHELEDVDFVIVEGRTACSDVILRSLASNQKSKIRRLAIPLLFWNDLSQFVTACPKLTELTIVCIHPAQSNRSEPGFLAEPIRAVHPAMLELVRACRVLPNFDTFQIVYFPNFVPLQATSYRHGDVRVPMNTELPKQQRTARKEAKGVGDLLMECLKLAEMKATLRFIELESELSEPLYLDAVKVEEYEMQ